MKETGAWTSMASRKYTNTNRADSQHTDDDDDDDDLHELCTIPVNRRSSRRPRSASLPAVHNTALINGLQRHISQNETTHSKDEGYNDPQLSFAEVDIRSRRSSSLPEFSTISHADNKSPVRRKESLSWASSSVGSKSTQATDTEETFRLPPISLTPTTTSKLNDNEMKKPDSLYYKARKKTYLPRISPNEANLFMTSRSSFNNHFRVNIRKDNWT